MGCEPLHAQARRVKEASRSIASATNEQRSLVLLTTACALREHSSEILTANEVDVRDYDDNVAGRDRLQLTNARLDAMADSLDLVSALSDPLTDVIVHPTRPNGLRVSQRRVPLGVVGVIYENRPNVTTDVAGLCVKSGNAAFLRGSSTAQRTNDVLVRLWQESLASLSLPVDAVSLVADTSRETALQFMALHGFIDCLIPRGGRSLVAAMREHARVPFVVDGDGNCHIYVDEEADLEMAGAVVANAKMSRPGVCNAAETLLVHEAIAPEFLGRLPDLLPGVELRADERARVFLPHAVAATDEDYATEFLDLVLAIAVVTSCDDAIEHVAKYSSGHSEAIITANEDVAAKWTQRVDAAAVLVNASTRFVDGGELGLGAEVGISTQKLHARGPMGLKELTCWKWVIEGKGQIR